MQRQLYAYDYADVPYDDAIELLADDAAALLEDATNSSVDHANEVVTRLHTPLGGLEVGRDIRLEYGEFEPVAIMRARLPLSWTASSRAALFPAVDGHLEVAALSLDPPRTQVTLTGTYEPPLGAVGAMADDAVGHRLAEATAKHFVEDVVRRLERLKRERHLSSEV